MRFVLLCFLFDLDRLTSGSLLENIHVTHQLLEVAGANSLFVAPAARQNEQLAEGIEADFVMA